MLAPEFRKPGFRFLLGQPLKDAYISLAKRVNHRWVLTPLVANDLRGLACSLERRADYRIHADRQSGTQFHGLSDALGIQIWIQRAELAMLCVESGLSMTPDE